MTYKLDVDENSHVAVTAPDGRRYEYLSGYPGTAKDRIAAAAFRQLLNQIDWLESRVAEGEDAMQVLGRSTR